MGKQRARKAPINSLFTREPTLQQTSAHTLARSQRLWLEGEKERGKEGGRERERERERERVDKKEAEGEGRVKVLALCTTQLTYMYMYMYTVHVHCTCICNNVHNLYMCA